MNSGIYVIENRINGMKYVGQSQNLKKRINASHDGCIYLLRAFEKYGKENFITYVVEYCDKENLNEREIYYIKKLNSHSTENGYNVSWGGEAPMRNRKHTEETKSKIGFWSTGSRNPLYGIRKFAGDNPFFGKTHKEETNEINRQAHLGKKTKRAVSMYYGVSFCNNWWRASIRIKRQSIFICNSKKEESCAIAYDIFVIYNNLSVDSNFPESRQSYADHLNKFEINDITDLRKVIKLYLEAFMNKEDTQCSVI